MSREGMFTVHPWPSTLYQGQGCQVIIFKKTGPDIKTPHALRKRENGEGYPPSCKIVIAAPQGLGQSPS